MELEQAELFVAAAERDYRQAVEDYAHLVEDALDDEEVAVRVARADVLAAQQVLDMARSEEWRARQNQEERHRAEEERPRRQQGPSGHDGWCDHCGSPAGVMAWGDVDLCPSCHTRELRAAAGEEEDR